MEKAVYLSSYSTASAHLMKLPENEYSKTRRESLNVRRNPLGVVTAPLVQNTAHNSSNPGLACNPAHFLLSDLPHSPITHQGFIRKVPPASLMSADEFV